MSNTPIFIHDIKLPEESADPKLKAFAKKFNHVGDLFQKTKDPELSDEERTIAFDHYWQAKYCLEQGIG